ncbi:hypothetical protein [Acidovorax sp. 39-64-12]|uniref:hypothetical protein n=1 Tax=Acidovorax sp. 39-64-12 TaxID=1970313 RepID=UPI0025BF5F3C|nr:hypothetical protein [Acidovorax sp. 39-64-12]
MSESIPNDLRVVPGLDAQPSKLPLAAFKPASDPAYSGMVEANQKRPVWVLVPGKFLGQSQFQLTEVVNPSDEFRKGSSSTYRSMPEA